MSIKAKFNVSLEVTIPSSTILNFLKVITSEEDHQKALEKFVVACVMAKVNPQKVLNKLDDSISDLIEEDNSFILEGYDLKASV